MNRLFVLLGIAGIFCIASVLFQSCNMDKYNIDRLKYQDDEWELKITAPLFRGDLELKDLINSGEDNTLPEDALYLRFSPDSVVRIPASAVFEPYLFLDKFFFLIADEYRIIDGKISFEVTNGCPLPFNLQLIFYQNSMGRTNENVFLPPVFSAAQTENELLFPVSTIHETTLSSETFEFVHKNRVGFVSWFDNTATADNPDTLDAGYRIEMKVILSATIKGIKDEGE